MSRPDVDHILLGQVLTLDRAGALAEAVAIRDALSERDRELVAPATQLDALGVPVACGTDNSPCNPLATMRAMRTRRERTTGEVLGGAACSSAELALRAMTRNGAWFSFEEAVKGRIAPGYFADLAVLSGCPLTTAADELESLSCLATMVGGRLVHGGV